MNSIVNKVASNSGIIIAGSIITTIAGMLSNIILVRYLGSADFGIYSFVFVYLGFFGILLDLGTSRIIVREISRDKANAPRLVGNAIVMRFFFSIICLILAGSIISLLKYPIYTKNLVIFALISFLFSFSAIYPLIFQACLKMWFTQSVSILASLLRLAFFVFFIFAKMPLLWFIAGTIAADIPGYILMIFNSRKLIRPIFEISLSIWKMLIRESWPIALTGAFIMIFLRIDQVMLFQMQGKEATGYYSAVVKLAEIFNLIPSAFIASVFPILAEYYISSKGDFKKIYEKSFKYMSIVIMPVVILVLLHASLIIRLIYGEGYLPASQSLKILIWSEILVFLGIVHVNTLIAAGLQKYDFIFTSAGAALNILLNLILIPRYGINGAALASVISYGIGVPLSCFIKATRPYGLAFVRAIPKPLICALAMGLLVLWLKSMPVAVNCLIGIVSYVVILWLIKGFNKDDIILLKKLLGPIRNA